MVALIAVLLAAPPVPVTQQGAWLEMQAGPQVLFRGRRAGLFDSKSESRNRQRPCTRCCAGISSQ